MREPRSAPSSPHERAHDDRDGATDLCAVRRGEQVAFGVLRERALHATCERLHLDPPRAPSAFAQSLPSTVEQAVRHVRADQHALLHGRATDEDALHADLLRGVDEAEALLREVGQCGETVAEWFARVREVVRSGTANGSSA